MRRGVTTVMSGVSVLVAGVSFRASEQAHGAVLSGAPAGVLQGAATGSGAASRVSPPAATSAVPPPLVTATPRAKPTPTTVTVSGSAADTRYGPVQVQITVSGGRIVKADAINYPQNTSRDQEINSQAIPPLDDETLQAQSSQIDTVSGATYTSDGYVASLQSAIDAAHSAGGL